MAPSSLDIVSNEILYQICGYVEDTHRPSIISLALVNKRFRSLVTSVLFYKLRPTQDKYRIEDTFQALPVVVIQNTRHLTIDAPPDSYRQQTSSALHNSECKVGNLADKKRDENSIWRPLVILIEQIPALADFVYTYSHVPPRCVFDALTKHHPTSRLHLEKFELSSLQGWEQPALNSYESLLVTSPCLHSLKFRHGYCGGDLVPDYHLEAVLDLTAGLAPNLREISLHHLNIPSTPFRPAQDREPWKGLRLEPHGAELLNQAPTCGSISRLSFHCSVFVETFKPWSRSTSLASLRSLELKSNIDVDLLKFMTTKCEFTTLNSFAAELDDHSWGAADYPDDYLENLVPLDNALAQFLLTIPPLKKLDLVGDIGEVAFDAVLEHHGPTLQTLGLQPNQRYQQFALDLEQLDRLKDHCGQVETLTIKVRRSRGDAVEVASYKALGALPRLQALNLTLDASNYAVASQEYDDVLDHEGQRYEQRVPNDTRFDAKDRRILSHTRLSNDNGIRRGFLRDALVNCALDEPLARSIFTTIASSKPHFTTPLESMSVTVDGAFVFGIVNSDHLFDFERLALRMKRSWLVQRNPRDDSGQVLVTTVLKKGAHDQNNHLPIKDDAAECFKSLWPESDQKPGNNEGVNDWVDSWHSFPLEL